MLTIYNFSGHKEYCQAIYDIEQGLKNTYKVTKLHIA